MIRFILLAASLSVLGMGCMNAGAEKAKVGERVWAQWRPNAWYPGKVTRTVPTGLHVVFDDGDEADLPSSQVAVDRVPPTEQVQVNSRVLAPWLNGRYYPGKITSISNGIYGVQFDDGDFRTARIEHLRLRSE